MKLPDAIADKIDWLYLKDLAHVAMGRWWKYRRLRGLLSWFLIWTVQNGAAAVTRKAARIGMTVDDVVRWSEWLAKRDAP